MELGVIDPTDRIFHRDGQQAAELGHPHLGALTADGLGDDGLHLAEDGDPSGLIGWGEFGPPSPEEHTVRPDRFIDGEVRICVDEALQALGGFDWVDVQHLRTGHDAGILGAVPQFFVGFGGQLCGERVEGDDLGAGILHDSEHQGAHIA